MRNFIIGLLFVWLFSCSVAIQYLNKADDKLLDFADFVIDDNLKNVIQSGGQTYYIIDTVKVDIGRTSTGVDFVMPVYVAEKDLDKLANWKRRMVLMVKEYDQLDITGKQIAAQANSYFKRKLAETQQRKEEKKKDAVSNGG
jgi:hypothetical protein